MKPAPSSAPFGKACPSIPFAIIAALGSLPIDGPDATSRKRLAPIQPNKPLDRDP